MPKSPVRGEPEQVSLSICATLLAGRSSQKAWPRYKDMAGFQGDWSKDPQSTPLGAS